jgi:putative redox protein
MTTVPGAPTVPANSVVIGDPNGVSAKVGNVEFPVGAASEGPTPYDLLSTSLAACTAMTVRFHARRNHYPLSHIDVAVSYHHAAEGERDYFERTIRLGGNLDDEQRARLMLAANMCPVAKALAKEIRTRAAESPISTTLMARASYQDDLNMLSIPNIDPD